MTPRRLDVHAVITGASSGIGAALARELHGRGARVTLVARRQRQLEALANQLGERCQVIVQDVSAETPAAWLDACHRLGPIDVLINNAGVGQVGPFSTSGASDGARVLAVDLSAPIRIAHHVLPPMLERGRGVLVNVSSVVGLAPPAGMAWYAAAKAGLAAFSEALHDELRGSGVHVLTVYPGPIDHGRPQDAYAAYGASSIVGRLPVGTPEELAGEIVRAVEARRARLIYPRFYALTWWLGGLIRWVVSRATPRPRGVMRGA